MPPLSLVTRNTASGIPTSNAISDDTPTINSVSMAPCTKRSNHITQHLHVLCPIPGAAAQCFGLMRRAVHRQQQLPQGMPLNPFHAALQQAHAPAEGAEQCGQVGLIGGAAGELQTQ